MPSPIAHVALLFFAMPAAERGTPMPTPRRLVLAAMIATLLILPDLDFVFYLLNITDAQTAHGDWTHSLILALPVGVIFAILAAPVFPKGNTPSKARLTLVGTAAYASHVLMDWTNWGFGHSSGYMLFWPFNEQPYRSPVSLFVGLRWSEPGAYLSHLLTLSTEFAFAAAIGILATARARRARNALEDQ